MRAVIVAGEPLTSDSFDHFSTRYECVGFRARALSSGYGMSELAGAITQWMGQFLLCRGRYDAKRNRIDVVGPGRFLDHSNICTMSSGHILPTIEIQIRDDDGAVRQDGEVGHIHVKSPSVALNLLANPLSKVDDCGFLNTGDRGAIVDNQLFVLGRSDDAFLVSGVIVFPEIIEGFLAQEAPLSGGELLCFGVWSESKGTNETYLAIYAENVSSATELAEQMEQTIRGHLVEHFGIIVHKLIWRDQPFVFRTQAGKIDRARTIHDLVN